MSKFNKSDFDPKAYNEARKAEMKEITEKLEQGVKDIFEEQNFKDYLDFCAKLPHYSINNQILIMLQKPDATMVQSFTAWKNAGRYVKKGEKGIRILAPAPFKIEKETEKRDDNGNLILNGNGTPEKENVEVKINSFKTVCTYDITQTDGDPVPTIGVDELIGQVNGYNALLESIKNVIPIPISFEDIKSGAKGFYQLEENRIVVKTGMSEVQTIKTLLHESSHFLLHSKEAQSGTEKKSKNKKEVEAEAVAYVVSKHFKINTDDYSLAYVASYSADKDVPELKESLETIRKTSMDLIDLIEKNLQGKTKSRKIA